MREYLTRLRENLGLNAKEMDKNIYDIFGIKVRCRDIEKGHLWSKITPEKARILAEAYHTTPEIILTLEANEGKWEGRNYYATSSQSTGSSIYDKPLTPEESATAERLFDWLQKVIAHMKYNRYSSYVMSGLVSDADIEDSAYIGYIRGIKALSVAKKDKAQFISTLDECAISRYEKWFIRRKIYFVVGTEICKNLAEKRLGDSYAVSIDAGIKFGDEECNMHESVPDRSIPVDRLAESSYMLSKLYDYLDSHQKYICSLLIKGFTKKDIVKAKISTRKEIGLIAFYVNQLINFGKIRWRESEYVSNCENVQYNFIRNLWEVKMMIDGKRYALGMYDDINTALDVQLAASVLRDTGGFMPWYERHRNVESAFTYPLLGDEEEYSELCMRKLAYKDPDRAHVRTPKAASAEKPYGISFIKQNKSYHVTYGKDYLGDTKTFDEALTLRKTAEKMVSLGKYTEWYDKLRSKRADTNKLRIYISYEKCHNNYKYRVSQFDKENKKRLHLGTYNTLEEAERIRDEAQEHYKKSAYAEWYAEFKSRSAARERRR